MTERMENALNHIKTSVDVDPWAVEVVEKMFEGVDDAITEIIEEINKQSSIPYYTAGSIQISDIGVGLKIALDVIKKHRERIYVLAQYLSITSSSNTPIIAAGMVAIIMYSKR